MNASREVVASADRRPGQISWDYDRAEIIADLKATGWNLEFDAMRREIAEESLAVRNFSDECRFWVARKA